MVEWGGSRWGCWRRSRVLMKKFLLDILVCPKCGGTLDVETTEVTGDEIVEGELTCAGCRDVYPIRRSIGRFVPRENYSSSFGFQ